jgi:serine/threonine protein kinase
MDQVASGLDAAHASHVIHTDLKSENIMLVPESTGKRAVITDFGLAVRVDNLPRWRDNAIAGTIAYMAPEQFGGGQTSRATDIYALGVVLFELLTGHLPFTPDVLAESCRCGIPLPMPSLTGLAQIPNGWVPVITRCLDPSPRVRYATAQQVVAALRAVPTSLAARSYWRPAVLAGIAVVVAVSAVSLGSSPIWRQARVAKSSLQEPALPVDSGLDTRRDGQGKDGRPGAQPPDAAEPSQPRTDSGRKPTAPRRAGKGTAATHERTRPAARQESTPGADDLIDPHGWR